ncbi:hypothetical protein KDA_11030 [Dictyobacter alpinus]|uniref:Pyrrolo-quinoline quinone repeat domain-containing protein n=1 Tax=Dictyobacter alpinus TaxID=2014873 RepID=A0A402B2P7_9CHLR|nr:PQQ-binding-like beta-propeller repeat protein [Dictyobacter alpinus]GCE25619.1 hypothetical protein KDA_11030 [Dictyobacter alpinus]
MSQDEARESLTPENIDQYIAQMANGEPAEARLNTHLQQFFQEEAEEDAALERVHQRLHLHMSIEAQKKNLLAAQRSTTQRDHRERNHPMNIAVNAPRGPIINRRVVLAVASTAAILLVASFLFALHLRQPSLPTATITPTYTQSKPIYVNFENQLVKLDPQTKHVLWRYQIGTDPNTDVITGNPVVSGNTIYFVMQKTGKIYAVDAQTGKLRWNNLLSTIMVEQPYIVDGVVYVGYKVNNNDQILTEVRAFNTNGTIKKNYGSIGTIEGIINGVMYTYTCTLQPNTPSSPSETKPIKNTLTAIRISDGHQLWQRILSEGKQVWPGFSNTHSVIAHVSVQGSILYVPADLSTVYQGTSRPYTPISYMYGLDIQTGAPVWKSPVINSGNVTEPILDKGKLIYFIDATKGEVDALDPLTNTFAWKKSFPGWTTRGSSIIVDNTMYIEQLQNYGQDASGRIISLDTRTGKQNNKITTFKIPQWQSWSTAHFVPEDHAIFLATSSNIIGIDVHSGNSKVNISLNTLFGKNMDFATAMHTITIVH